MEQKSGWPQNVSMKYQTIEENEAISIKVKNECSVLHHLDVIKMQI